MRGLLPRPVVALSALLLLTGCYALHQDPRYAGPPPRPAELTEYYTYDATPRPWTSEIIRTEDDFVVNRLLIESPGGTATVDYYQHPGATSDSLILVFPVLGGKKNLIENYFAEYFARHGFETAIVHRQDDFKKPENVDRLEEIFRNTIIRDRVALDLFEREFGKKQFGTFGLSRGAINVAMSAGVDPRLKHNVMLMGGSDLVSMFKRSNQRRIKFFVADVTAKKNISAEQFLDDLREQLKSDPKRLAHYIDARESLLFLGMFDRTVPIRYGYKLRRQLGNPETVFLPADHYLSIAWTGLPNAVLAGQDVPVYPFDYVETESLYFYRRAFNTDESTPALLPWRILRAPFDLIGRAIATIRGTPADEEFARDPWAGSSAAAPDEGPSER